MVSTILGSHCSKMLAKLTNLTNLYRLGTTEVPIALSQNSTLTASGDSSLLLAQAIGLHGRPDLVIEMTHHGPCENSSQDFNYSHGEDTPFSCGTQTGRPSGGYHGIIGEGFKKE